MFSEKDAQTLLEPYHAVLFRIVTTAWRKWHEMRDHFDEPYTRTMAVNVHQFMTEAAKRAFLGRRDVRIVEEHETILISFGNNISVRLKKLNEHLGTSNYKTQRLLDLEAQLPLPGVPDGERVVVGYLPDNLGQEIEVHVVYSQAGSFVWSYDLSDYEVAEEIFIDSSLTQKPEAEWTFTPKTDEGVKREQSAS